METLFWGGARRNGQGENVEKKKKGLPDYVQSRLWMHQTLRRAKPRARVRGGAKASGHGVCQSLTRAYILLGSMAVVMDLTMELRPSIVSNRAPWLHFPHTSASECG